MHVAPDPLLLGFSSPKTFTLRNMPYTLSFCAETNGEVAESILKNNAHPLGEGGPSKTVGEGQTRTLPPPLIRHDWHLLTRDKVFLR